MTQIPLNQLRFGHEATPPINARVVGRDAKIESLKASIKSHGLGQALNCREIDGKNFVADGNRRLRCLQLLAEEGWIKADEPIKCDFKGDTDGDELSLALNLEREPMHEADVYQKFHELHDRGSSPDQIANRFGIEVKRVNRMLALGKLAPEILDAWRSGNLGNQPTETVRAFTLAPSTKEQVRVLKKLQQSGQIYASNVRSEFGADDRDVNKYIKLVGLDAYKAAGGSVTEDLFGDNHAIADPALAKKLADEWIEVKCAEFIAEGWSWAKPFTELPEAAQWNWERLYTSRTLSDEQSAEIAKLEAEIEAIGEDENRWDVLNELDEKIDEIRANAVESWTPEQKKRGGVAIGFGFNPEINITHMVNPATDKPKAADKKTAADKKPAGISVALNHRLSLQLSQAAQAAIGASPHNGLAALVAAMGVTYSGDSPVKVRLSGVGTGYHGAVSEPRKAVKFEDLFANCLKMTSAELIEAASKAMARGIDLQQQGGAHPVTGMAAALTAAMDGPALEAALLDQFDAEDFFRVAPKAIALHAIKEALNDDEARKAEKLKKGELVAFAVANVPQTGWLPSELRTVHYSGPGAKPAAKNARGRKAA